MKRFNMIDESFVCSVCNCKVNKLNYTARDHCPNCLCSIHLDNNPGDRASSCHGILNPIDVEKFKDSYKIIYKCSKCGIIKKNKIADDDNFDCLLDVMKNKEQVYDLCCFW